MAKQVLIPLADGCEELEAVTIIDLLRRGGIQVVTAGVESLQIMASRGTQLIADVLLDDVAGQSFDMVVLPGGQPGTDNLNNDPLIHDILIRHSDNEHAIAAICAAPLILADAGLLQGKTISCYPGSIDPAAWPDITVTEQAVTIDGNIITSRGPATALDFALTLITLLQGDDVRQQVETALMGESIPA